MLAAVLAASAVSGCGFRLRGAGWRFAFRTLRLQAPAVSDVVESLRAQLQAAGVTVLDDRALPPTAPHPAVDVVLQVLLDQRERAAVGATAAGQVRVLVLRRRLRFTLRTPSGRELIAATELVQEREMSFSETVALSKEAEEALLFDDMRAAIVRQLLLRLSAVSR